MGRLRQAEVDADLLPGSKPIPRPLVVHALVHPGHQRQRRRVAFQGRPFRRGVYPIETYIMARAIEGLEQGIYHFRPRLFDLEFIKAGSFETVLAEAALGQDMIREAQTTFIWTAIVARGTWKYRQRAYRYIYMDAGHIGQNLYLAGTAAGLGICAVGAFFDDRVNDLIEVDGVEETTVYLAAVGWPRT